MEWTDDGIVISLKRHGESSAIVGVLTKEHGRCAGLLRGATGKRLRGVVQPGNRVRVRWRARLAEHLGTWSLEPTGNAVTAFLLSDPVRLVALGSACALIEACLPEREPHPSIQRALDLWLDLLVSDGPWAGAYVKWEQGLLAELGFGLDLTSCAATGAVDDLIHVSPKSGRAVSAEAGVPYKDRLLPLPKFLLQEGAAGDPKQVRDGLTLTGYFLDRHLFHGEGLPAARRRFFSLF
ncbi:Putative DNA repair protein RecO (Recombination protein O) [Magnetospira sp. QH-2]|nr:DNA repair protein RecO [Magnetospira sp. QH-2]CCQ73581.1 Putative DNA repair protein RecO (Recombination protein O) [Magnetospira sp. QH-2]